MSMGIVRVVYDERGVPATGRSTRKELRPEIAEAGNGYLAIEVRWRA